MKVKAYKERPNFEEILEETHLWTLNTSEFDAIKAFERFDKSYMIYTNFSNTIFKNNFICFETLS